MNVDTRATLLVPEEYKSAYQSAEKWQDFKAIETTNNIYFADANVKALCVTKWDTNGDGELSETEAAAVTDIGGTFREKAITTFDELQYFTGLTSIASGAFEDCFSLRSVALPNGIATIGSSAFYDCYNLASLNLPEGLTSIGEYAFYDCRSLVNLDFPDGIAAMGNYVCSNCSSLSQVHLPLGITAIGDHAFDSCSSLTCIDIPVGVKKIGGWAFISCTKLAEVTMHEEITTIGSTAFSDCNKLTSVTVGAILPPKIDSNNTFSNCSKATLYVHNGCKAAYEAANYWKDFKKIVEMPKCATPTISIEGGKVRFSCETDGVEYAYEIENLDMKQGFANEINLRGTYKVSVYATKAGYDNSDIATVEFSLGDGGMKGDVNGDKLVDIADVTAVINIINQ